MSDAVHKKYTKKIIIKNEQSTPEARAERLKRVRNLANLTRKEICDNDEININTYKGWELARFGGLPQDGAEKVVKRVFKEGVICSIDWLLYGKSPAPYLIPETTSLIEVESPEKNIILKEFDIYKNFFPNAILIEVTDDTLLPKYQPGDFLAGLKKYGKDIYTTLNQICIVETINGDTYIRYLKKGLKEGFFDLLCYNLDSNEENIAILNIKLSFSAPITRHYLISSLS